MSEEMVERVARAIQSVMVQLDDHELYCASDPSNGLNEDLMTIARAASTAMRPTDAEITKAYEECDMREMGRTYLVQLRSFLAALEGGK